MRFERGSLTRVNDSARAISSRRSFGRGSSTDFSPTQFQLRSRHYEVGIMQ